MSSAFVEGGTTNYFKDTLTPVVVKIKKEDKAKDMTPKTFLPKAEGGEVKKKEKPSAAKVFVERVLAFISVIAALIGMFIGWNFFKNDPHRKLPPLFANKWYLDEIYNKGIVDPITSFSRNFLWKGFDVGVVDGIVNGAGTMVSELAGVFRKIQVGFVRSYAALILLGALCVVGYFVYYAFKLVG